MYSKNNDKTMKKMLFAACLVLMALAACDKEERDGDWSPIKFTKNPLEVPAEGGTVQTLVRNYPEVWLLSVWRDGERMPVEMPDEETEAHDMFRLKTKHITVLSEKQSVTVIVEPSGDGKPHKFDIEVEYGDAFSTLVAEKFEI